MGLLILFGGGGVTIDAPIATATADGVTPLINVAIIDAPLGDATGDGLTPTLAFGEQVDAPIAEAVGGPELVPTVGVFTLVEPDPAAVVADGLVPALALGHATDAPVAGATGDGILPTIVGGRIIAAPLAEAVADGLVAGVGSVVTAPLATAVGDGLVPAITMGVTINAPVAPAVGQPSPPFALERLARFGLVTPAKLASLGSVVHVLMAPSGETDHPLIGDWEANEEAPGGFMGASGQVPASVAKAKPEVYTYGTNWRTFHAETGECLWEGRLLEPEYRGDVAQLQGRGLAERIGARQYQRLLFQSRDEQKWTDGSSFPMGENFTGYAEVTPGYWTFGGRRGALRFERSGNEGGTNRMVPFEDGASGSGIEAFFFAPGVPDGGLQRLSFRVRAAGGASRGKHARDEDAGYQPPPRDTSARTYQGVTDSGTGGTPNTINAVGVEVPYAYTDAGSWENTGIDEGREYGPTCPAIRIYAGRWMEDYSEIGLDLNVVAEFYPYMNTATDFFDIDLHRIWTDSNAYARFPDPFEDPTRSVMWSRMQGMLWGARVPSAEGLSGKPWDGSMTYGHYYWMPFCSLSGGNWVEADPYEIQRVDMVMISVGDGLFRRDGNKWVFNDDPNAPCTVELIDVRIDGIGARTIGETWIDQRSGATQTGHVRMTLNRDRMHASQAVAELANLLEIDDRFVQRSPDNCMPLDFEGASVDEALTYLSLIGGRRHRFLHTGTNVKLEFGPWRDRIWKVMDDRQEFQPQPLERYDHVIVPFEYPSGQVDWVQHRSSPSPLERRNSYGLAELSDPLHKRDPAEHVAISVLEHLETRRFGGDAHIAEVVDENGIRRSAHHVHAGDVVEHVRFPGRGRVKSLRRTDLGVDLTFDDGVAAVDKLSARRGKRLERRRH